jgi:hypothetical protein
MTRMMNVDNCHDDDALYPHIWRHYPPHLTLYPLT